MSVLSTLMQQPGVLAAGEYAYRGDRFSYRGVLSEEQARIVTIMCRATTLGLTMQGDMLRQWQTDYGLLPVRGWLIRGPDYSFCALANVFCLCDNQQLDVDALLNYLRLALAGDAMDLV